MGGNRIPNSPAGWLELSVQGEHVNPGPDGKDNVDSRERSDVMVAAVQVQEGAATDCDKLRDQKHCPGIKRRKVPGEQRIGLDTGAYGVDADVRHDPIKRLNDDERQPSELRVRQPSRRNDELGPSCHAGGKRKRSAIKSSTSSVNFDEKSPPAATIVSG